MIIVVVIVVVVVSLGVFFSVIYDYVDQQMCFEAKFDTQNKKKSFPFMYSTLLPSPLGNRLFLFSFLYWYDKRYYYQFNMPLGSSCEM